MIELPVYSDDGRRFGSVTNRRVLIYWPHGLGDFVHLSFVVPLLEPTNEYCLTRFGDDFVHLYEVGERVLPLFSGTREPGKGSALGARPHFGLDLDHPPDGITRLDVPEPLRSRIEEHGIEALLVCRYPEMTGRTPYPWQTKARYLASRIAAPQRLACTDLSQPLRSSLAFRAPLQAEQRIEARLREAIPTGARLYVLSAGGHTQVDKVWPEHEIAAFAREVRRRDSHARLVTVDERTSAVIGRESGIAPTTTDLFGDLELPFAHVLVTLVRAAHAYVGVASGPLHAAIAMGGRPTVGLWLAHWPEYYDEPSSEAIHLVGPEVYRRGLDRRIGARTKARAGVLPYRIEAFRDRPPTSADALDALERV
ncbi:MAG: glycosyltransferase family 9 protein [Candidatus Aquilonibacter sp.]